MMKRIFAGLVVCSLAGLVGSSYAKDEPEYTALEAAKHIGENASVTDKVDDAYQAKGGNIFLNLGGKHPNEAFVVFIPVASASAIKDVKVFDGKTITVTGKIIDYQGKPEIVVKSPSQITSKVDDLSGATAAPAASTAGSASPAASASPESK